MGNDDVLAMKTRLEMLVGESSASNLVRDGLSVVVAIGEWSRNEDEVTGDLYRLRRRLE